MNKKNSTKKDIAIVLGMILLVIFIFVNGLKPEWYENILSKMLTDYIVLTQTILAVLFGYFCMWNKKMYTEERSNSNNVMVFIYGTQTVFSSVVAAYLATLALSNVIGV